MSRAASHQALHVFSVHSHRESGEMWEASGGGSGGETAKDIKPLLVSAK